MADYTQPFCVIGSKGTFCGARYGYLPPLELPEEEKEIAYTMPWTDNQSYQIQQLKNELTYLRGKFQELSETKRGGDGL